MATDDFARANSADLGANWTPQTGVNGGLAFRIVSQEALPDAAADESCEYWSADSYGDDQWAEIAVGGELETSTSALAYGTGPSVRIQTSGTGPYYARYSAIARTGQVLLYYQPDGEGWEAVQVGSTYTGTVTLGDIIRLEVEGTGPATLRVYQRASGQTRGGATDYLRVDTTHAGGPTGGAIGMNGQTANNYQAADDFEGGTLTGGGGGLPMPVAMYHLRTQGIA